MAPTPDFHLLIGKHEPSTNSLSIDSVFVSSWYTKRLSSCQVQLAKLRLSSPLFYSTNLTFEHLCHFELSAFSSTICGVNKFCQLKTFKIMYNSVYTLEMSLFSRYGGTSLLVLKVTCSV